MLNTRGEENDPLGPMCHIYVAVNNDVLFSVTVTLVRKKLIVP